MPEAMEAQNETTSLSFDEVLEDLRHFEESAPTEQPGEAEPSLDLEKLVEESPKPEPPAPPEALPLNLSEKERVLRKVLGEKYKQGDEE